MGRSKINFGDETLIDLTGDSVTPEAMLSGVTAHNAAGDPIEGTLVPGDMHTSTYDPQGKAQDVFAYADAQAGAAMDEATAAASAASSAQSAASSAASAASSAQSAASSAQAAATRAQDTADTKLAKSGDGSNVTAAFTKASSRTNIATGEKLSVLFGKIAKWLADLGSLAFKSTVAKSDLAADVQTSLGKADTAITVTVNDADNGKFLRVVNGAWAAAVVDSANGVSF